MWKMYVVTAEFILENRFNAHEIECELLPRDSHRKFMKHNVKHLFNGLLRCKRMKEREKINRIQLIYTILADIELFYKCWQYMKKHFFSFDSTFEDLFIYSNLIYSAEWKLGQKPHAILFAFSSKLLLKPATYAQLKLNSNFKSVESFCKEWNEVKHGRNISNFCRGIRNSREFFPCFISLHLRKELY